MSAVAHAVAHVESGLEGRGGTLPRFELTGPEHGPLVVALGGISADRHVCANRDDTRAGWWESIAGEGRALDTLSFRLLGIDFVHGGERFDGRPERIVTTRDQADAIAAVLENIGAARAFAVVGASYGGMVALALAERYPELVGRLVVIGAAHESHPLTTAWRVIQRRTVELGLSTGRVHEALVLARSLAMTTYRTAGEFAERFSVEPAEVGASDATFEVESYLRHHGEKFAARFNAARFLALSLSSDLHRVDPSRIEAPTVLVAEQGDAVVPVEQTEELLHLLRGPARIERLHSTHGHDAFLTEPARLGAILIRALSPDATDE